MNGTRETKKLKTLRFRPGFVPVLQRESKAAGKTQAQLLEEGFALYMRAVDGASDADRRRIQQTAEMFLLQITA